MNFSHLIKNVFLSVELKNIFYQAEFVFVFKFSVVISRSVALFLFLCREPQNSQNFYAGKLFFTNRNNFLSIFFAENAKNARKNKIGYIPYYDVIYRNKSDSYAVLIGFRKNARTKFFYDLVQSWMIFH